MTYEAIITPTTRAAGRGQAWHRSGSLTEAAATLRDLKAKLRAYGKPRTPIYVDTETGTKRIGTIYHATAKDRSGTTYYQNWIVIQAVTRETLD